MVWQYTPYALGSLMTAVLAAGLSVYALRRRGIPGARMAALFMAAVSLWGAAYAVELGATDLASNNFWSKVGYVGIVSAERWRSRARLVRGPWS